VCRYVWYRHLLQLFWNITVVKRNQHETTLTLKLTSALLTSATEWIWVYKKKLNCSSFNVPNKKKKTANGHQQINALHTLEMLCTLHTKTTLISLLTTTGCPLSSTLVFHNQKLLKINLLALNRRHLPTASDSPQLSTTENWPFVESCLLLSAIQCTANHCFTLWFIICINGLYDHLSLSMWDCGCSGLVVEYRIGLITERLWVWLTPGPLQAILGKLLTYWGKLSLLPSAGQEMSSNSAILGYGVYQCRPRVADWGDGVSASCTAGPIVC